MPRLLLIDDHAILRSGARSIIERHVMNAVVTEADSLGAALSLLADGLDADLAVLDLGLPDADGKSSIAALRQGHPSMPVIVLSAATEEAERALLFGAVAFVPKNGEPMEIVSAIRAVLAGDTYVPGLPVDSLGFEGLSERQRELMAACAEGLSNKEIGRRLGISDNTVRAHLALLFRRFNVKTRMELAGLSG